MKLILIILLFISFNSKSYSIEGILIKTVDYSFKDKWNNTLSKTTPKITNQDIVYKKQYFYLGTIINDYKVNINNIADVTYSITLNKPDGTNYLKKDNLQIIKKKIIHKNYQLSDVILKICFENDDDFGEYSIRIIITDNISHETAILESKIILDNYQISNFKEIKNDETLVNWVENYYINPNPIDALNYYIYYSKSKLSENESSFWPIISFFSEIYKNNIYLFPQIIESFSNADLKTRIFLYYLSVFSDFDTKLLLNKLPDEEKEGFIKIDDFSMPNYYGLISSPNQLDMLWGEFRASGSYKPILKLIQTLEYEKYKGQIENYKNSDKTDLDKQNSINNAIYNSLIWSFKSNIKQHELIYKYCKWALAYEDLTEIQKSELSKLLENY